MNLQSVGLQTHDDESPLAFMVMFDDLDRGRRMVATVSEAALIDSAAHPHCEAIDVEPMARGTVQYEKYETEAVVRVIKKFLRDRANRQNQEQFNWIFGDSLQQQYKGYTISGSAESVHNDSGLYFARANVLLTLPNMVCIQAYRDQAQAFVFDNEDKAQIVGLFLAEVAVDHFLPWPAYYVTPMNIGRAVDILRRAADECKPREIRRPRLYEALDFLEQSVEPKWLVKRYRRELSGDRRNEREKNQLREALRVATRGIQQACVALLVDKLNELAVRFRENKAEIDHLRWQLDVFRRPVRLQRGNLFAITF